VFLEVIQVLVSDFPEFSPEIWSSEVPSVRENLTEESVVAVPVLCTEHGSSHCVVDLEEVETVDDVVLDFVVKLEQSVMDEDHLVIGQHVKQVGAILLGDGKPLDQEKVR
jgi:hypothetical protein